MFRPRLVPALALIFSASMIFVSATLAATVKDLAICSAKQDSVERLDCFDDLAKAEKADVPDTSSADKGDWNVTSETSKINDQTNVYLEVQSEDNVRGRFGETSKAAIHIVCREGHTDFYLTYGGNFLADIQGYGDVTLRLDKQKARVISMTESTDHEALGLWNGTGGKQIKSMFGASRLFTSVVPFNESTVTAEFKIAGMEQAISPLRKACKW